MGAKQSKLSQEQLADLQKNTYCESWLQLRNLRPISTRLDVWLTTRPMQSIRRSCSNGQSYTSHLVAVLPPRHACCDLTQGPSKQV